MAVPVDPPGKVEIACVGELLGQVHVGGGHAVLHPQGQQPGQEAHQLVHLRGQRSTCFRLESLHVHDRLGLRILDQILIRYGTVFFLAESTVSTIPKLLKNTVSNSYFF